MTATKDSSRSLEKIDEAIVNAQGGTGREGLGKANRALGFSSLAFAVLQSICGLFIAISGLRLALGIGSLAISAGATAMFARLHADRFRIPMVIFALLGAALNLAVLAQIRYLRARPASQWRQRPVSSSQLRMERVQWVLSLLTLVLLGVEEWLHFRFHGIL